MTKRFISLIFSCGFGLFMDLEQGAQEGIAGKQEGETAHVDAEESVEAPVKSDASTANGKRAKLSISKYGYAAIALFIKWYSQTNV